MDFLSNSNMARAVLSLGIFLSAYMTALLIIRIINRRIADLKRRHSARKATLYGAMLLAISVTAILWIKNLNNIFVVISVIGAGLVVALGDLFLSFAGWFLIILTRPFDIGDRVELGDVKGDVIDIRLFQTSLLEIGNWVKEDQSTGRVVHVPNSAVLKRPVFNCTRGFEFLWSEIKIAVTFESDWMKAEDIMLKYAQKEVESVEKEAAAKIKEMADQYFIFYEKLTPIVYTKILDNGIELSLRFLTHVKRRRQSEDALNRAILNAFGAHKDINFAYPTYRLVR